MTTDERNAAIKRRRTWLEINRADGSVELMTVSEYGTCGAVCGPCPGCKQDPFYIKCHAAQMVDDYTIKAGAKCTNCGDNVGWVYHKPPTMFGLTEGAAVQSRARIY